MVRKKKDLQYKGKNMCTPGTSYNKQERERTMAREREPFDKRER
jgi:hypothetical protein